MNESDAKRMMYVFKKNTALSVDRTFLGVLFLTRRFFCIPFIVVLSCFDPAWSQHTVLRPDDISKFDEYTLAEWMMSAGGWGSTSYDNLVLRPAPYHVDLNHRAPDVFINGVPVRTAWLHHPMLHLNHFSKNYIDSLVIYPPGSFVHHVNSPSGAIDIYLDETRRLQGTVFLANQVNDPGPMSSFKYSPNVERIKEHADLLLNVRKGGYRSQLMAHISTYSYSNVFYYDRNIYYHKLIRRPESPAGMWHYQTPVSIIHTHQLKTSQSVYSSVLSLSHHIHNFLWDDWAGNEISSRYTMYNAGLTRSSRSEYGWSAALSYSFAHSTPFLDSHFYRYDIDQHGFYGRLNYSVRLRNQEVLKFGWVSDGLIYNSRSQEEILKSADNYASIFYQRGRFQGDLAAGPDKGGLNLVYHDAVLPGSFARAAWNRDFSSRLSRVFPRLETGFGLIRSNEKATFVIEEPPAQEYFVQSIGFSSSNRLRVSGSPSDAGNVSSTTGPSVSGSSSDAANISSTAGSSVSGSSSDAANISSAVRFGHEWSLSHIYFTSYPFRETRFESSSAERVQYPLNAHFVYRNLRNSGNLHLSARLNAFWKKWHSATRLAMTLHAWGDPQFIEENKRFAGIHFRQHVRYSLHNTFTMEGSYSYIGARSFMEFKTGPGDRPLWPPPETRAVHKASAAFHQSFFDHRLVMHLILRNFFNSTETWHPNGLFFNLSMMVGVHVQI